MRHSGVIINLHHPGLLSIVTSVHHVIRAGTLQAVDNLSLVGQLFQLELLIPSRSKRQYWQDSHCSLVGSRMFNIQDVIADFRYLELVMF